MLTAREFPVQKVHHQPFGTVTENRTKDMLITFEFSVQKVHHQLFDTVTAPQWGAADAEIKVQSGENTELKRSPFKAWSK